MSDNSISVSVVIPVFNETEAIYNSLNNFLQQGKKHDQNLLEIIIVDDGSDEPIDEGLFASKIDQRIKVLRQENSGRYSARENGIRVSAGNYILLFDSRVTPIVNSFDFLIEQLLTDGLDQIWVGPGLIDEKAPLIGHFWRGIEMIAWNAFYRSNGELTVPSTELAKYPIGTTYFGVSKERILRVLDANLDLKNVDGRYISDDTRLIKQLVTKSYVRYSPKFNCVYQPRSTLKAFLKHSYHRGRVFVDGHVEKGGRYLIPWLIMCLMAVLLPFAILIAPKLVVSVLIVTAFSSFFTLKYKFHLPIEERAALFIYGPAFLYFYLSGTIAALRFKWKKSDSMKKKA